MLFCIDITSHIPQFEYCEIIFPPLIHVNLSINVFSQMTLYGIADHTCTPECVMLWLLRKYIDWLPVLRQDCSFPAGSRLMGDAGLCKEACLGSLEF